MVKRVFTYGGIGFLLFFIAFRPSSAADVFNSLGGTVADIWGGLENFVRSLVN